MSIDKDWITPKNTEKVDIDLFERLSQATDIKFEPANPGGDPGSVNDTDFVEVNQNDFAPEPEPILQETPAEPAIKQPFSYYLAEAKVWVDFMDSTSKMYLPNLYRKKYFTPDEYFEGKKLLERAWDKTKPIIEELTPREIYLLEKMKALQEYEADLPFSLEAKEMITQPLAQVLSQNQANISPMTNLIIAIGIVCAPKVLPLLV